MKKLFLVIGAPGSGKTTDAQIIASRNAHSIIHYSTGDLLRDEIASKSDRGLEIESYVSLGKLVPLNIVVDTLVSTLEHSPKEIIIVDGYPRSVEQMQALDHVLENNQNIELISVIEVEVSMEVARERVLGRSRGVDDRIEVFSNRMKVFLDPLAAIETFYDSKGLLYKINGESSIEEVVGNMESHIQSKIKEKR